MDSFFTSINEIIAFCVYSGYFCPILKFHDLKHLCKKISNGEWGKYFFTVLYNNSHIICSHIKAVFLILFFNMTPSQNGLKTRSNFSESLHHELDEWSLKNRKKKCLKNILSITFDRLSIFKKSVFVNGFDGVLLFQEKKYIFWVFSAPWSAWPGLQWQFPAGKSDYMRVEVTFRLIRY